jgi:hypothetical protein
MVRLAIEEGFSWTRVGRGLGETDAPIRERIGGAGGGRWGRGTQAPFRAFVDLFEVPGRSGRGDAG